MDAIRVAEREPKAEIELNRLQMTLFAMLGLVAVFLLLVALRNPQAPLLPDDPVHGAFAGHAACLDCHGPASDYPQSRNHPVGNDCLRCHGRP